jgi:hypothetical protein
MRWANSIAMVCAMVCPATTLRSPGPEHTPAHVAAHVLSLCLQVSCAGIATEKNRAFNYLRYASAGKASPDPSGLCHSSIPLQTGPTTLVPRLSLVPKPDASRSELLLCSA